MSKQRIEFEFSARDNATPEFNKVQQAAIRTGKTLIDEANKQNLGARETVRYLEEQIKLLDKKNKLESQVSRVAIDDRYSAIRSNDANLKSQRQEEGKKLRELISSGASQEEIDKQREKLNSIRQGSGLSESDLRSNKTRDVTDLAALTRDRNAEVLVLRDILAAINRTANEEISNEDDNTSRESASNERAILLAGAGREFEDLAHNARREGEAEDLAVESESQQKRRGKGFFEEARGVAGSQSVHEAAEKTTNIISANPLLAAVAAIIGIGTIGLQARAGREVAAGQLAALTNRSASDIASSNVGTTNQGQFGALDLNVTREQFNSQYAPAAIRARGTSRDFEQAAMREIELDKGQALNTGQAAAMDRLSRVMEGQTDATRVFAKMISSTGSNVDKARYAEIAQLYTSFQEQQFSRTGTTNGIQTGGLMRVFDEMSRLPEFARYRRDDYKFNAISEINQGLTQPGSSEATGIRMAMLRQRNPNMGLFELQNELGKGLESKASFEDTLNFVKNTGGNKDQMQLLLSGLLGGNTSPQTIIDLVKGLQGGMDIGDISKRYAAANVDVRGDALKASSTAQMQVDFSKEAMNDVMSKIGSWAESIIKDLSSIANFIKNF